MRHSITRQHSLGCFRCFKEKIVKQKNKFEQLPTDESSSWFIFKAIYEPSLGRAKKRRSFAECGPRRRLLKQSPWDVHLIKQEQAFALWLSEQS
jgi:hypothetical protein